MPPSCLIDLMAASDVYKDDAAIITNDLIIAIMAATDTSRNTTITGLCHLSKTPASREKVRAEIDKCMKKCGVEEVMNLGYDKLTPANFVFLH